MELAETFVGPVAVPRDMPPGVELDTGGSDAGFAPHNGRHTDVRGSSKEMYVRPLHPRARKRLADAEDRADWAPAATPASRP